MLLIIESESVTINPWREDPIPEGSWILLVSPDLQARARVEAAAHPRGWRVEVRPPDAAGDPTLQGGVPAAAILDLDHMDDPAAWLDRLPARPGRLLGFYSHVRHGAGAAARAAGIEVYPRSRFWRELSGLLDG